MLGINSLITFFILFVWFTLNIFRKRGLTQSFKHSTERLFRLFPKKTDRSAAACGVVNYFSYQFFIVAKIKFVPNADLSCGVNYHIPKTIGLIQFTKQEHFDLSAGLFFTAIHPCRKNFCVIYYKYILIVKIIQDITEVFVLDLAGVTMYHHHTGILTFFCRVLSNKV